jgi:hypothetical protein
MYPNHDITEGELPLVDEGPIKFCGTSHVEHWVAIAKNELPPVT